MKRVLTISFVLASLAVLAQSVSHEWVADNKNVTFKNPVINAAVLKEYKDSLQGMAAAYASNSTKSTISSTVESQC